MPAELGDTTLAGLTGILPAVMNGIVAAVYASFLLALCDASLKKSYRDFEPSVAYAINAVLGLAIWVPLALLLGGTFRNFFVVLPFAIATAIAAEALYYYALSKGQLSITAIILASYPIYTILFSYVINNERLTSTQGAFIALAICGTLMSALPSKLSRQELRTSGAILWPVLGAVGAGVSDAAAKSVINRTSAYDFMITLALVQIPVALVYLRVEKQSLRLSLRGARIQPGDYMHAFAGALFAVVGMGLLWISFEYTLASIASPITATSGAIVVLITCLFMDERIRWRNAVGIALIFVAVLGLSRVV